MDPSLRFGIAEKEHTSGFPEKQAKA